MLNFLIYVLFLTDSWVFLYLKILNFLNRTFPAQVNQKVLWVDFHPEPFEIPLFILLSAVFVLLIVISQKIKLTFRLPKYLKMISSVILLAGFFIALGDFPLGNEAYPYNLRANTFIYIKTVFFYCLFLLLFAAVFVFLERKLRKRKIPRFLLYMSIPFFITLLTFEPGFPILGIDYSFFFAPILEMSAGKTIYVDFTSQYAFLTIEILTFFYRFTSFSLYDLPVLVWLLYIIQYGLIFYLLKKIGRSTSLSLLGLLGILTWNYYTIFHQPGSVPQVGPLRWLPLFLGLYSFYKLKRLDSVGFIFTLALLSLFTIDAGIALLLAYLATVTITWLSGKLSFIKLIRSVILLIASLLLILLTVSLIHLMLGYKPIDIQYVFTSLRKHVSLGLVMLPMPIKTYFWFIPLIYFASVIYFLQNPDKQESKNRQYLIINKQVSKYFDKLRVEIWNLFENWKLEIGNSENSLFLFSANLMLFASIYFVGRSHPHNLFNISLFPIFTLTLLLSFFWPKLKSNNFKLFTASFLFLILVIVPAMMRRFTLTEMALIKINRLAQGNIFDSDPHRIIQNLYAENIKFIKNNIRKRKTAIISNDDTYLFYESNKQNLLQVNPIREIIIPEDIIHAVNFAKNKCPHQIIADCSIVDRCQPYSTFMGSTFNLKLLLQALEKSCDVTYFPTICTGKLCLLKNIQ